MSVVVVVRAGACVVAWRSIVVALPQGLHAPFVATAALVIFRRRADRARLGISRGLSRRHSSSATGRPGRIIRWVTFLDAATWLAQDRDVRELGLLVSPQRLVCQHHSGCHSWRWWLIAGGAPLAVCFSA